MKIPDHNVTIKSLKFIIIPFKPFHPEFLKYISVGSLSPNIFTSLYNRSTYIHHLIYRYDTIHLYVPTPPFFAQKMIKLIVAYIVLKFEKLMERNISQTIRKLVLSSSNVT